MISPDVEADFDIWLETFPGQRKLTELASEHIARKQIRPTMALDWRKSLPDNFGENERLLATQKHTISITGSYRFDNGWGDIIPESKFCFKFVGAYSNGGAVFQECRFVDGIIRNELKKTH